MNIFKYAFFIIILLIVFGCDPNRTDLETETYHLNFSTDFISKDFTTKTGFYLNSLWPLDTRYYYNAGFNQNSSDSKNSFFIGLPQTITNGIILSQTSSQFYIYYFDSLNIKFILNSADSFTMTVIKWERAGGYGSGTFSGTLKEEGGSRTVSITNGKFRAFIHQN
jgi:hypothetical protein